MQLRVPSLLLLLAAAAAAALAGAPAAALYGPNSAVIQLGEADFAERVFGSEDVWIVEFYAPWCGHCKQLAPAYEKLAAQVGANVRVAAVDCDQHKGLPGAFGVQGFPTIKVFGQEQEAVKGGTGKGGGGVRKTPLDYNGPRTVKGMREFALRQLKGFVAPVADSDSSDSDSSGSGSSSSSFGAAEPQLKRALVLSPKAKVADATKALSTEFHHRLAFGHASLGKAPGVAKALLGKTGSDLNKAKLFVLPSRAEADESSQELWAGAVAFEGDLGDRKAVRKFLEEHAAPAPERPASGGKKAGGSSSSKKKQDEAPPPPPEHKHDVAEPIETQEEWTKTCVETNRMCFVALLDPQDSGHEAAVAALKAAAARESTQHLFKVVWIDGTWESQVAEQLGLQPYWPTAAVYAPKKGLAVPFVGAFSERAIGAHMDKIARGATGATHKVQEQGIVITGAKAEAAAADKDEL